MDSRRLSAEKVLGFVRGKANDFWAKEQESQALRLFRSASARVPAYKDFLKKNKIQPGKIRTFKDFQLVPPISKKNYLREYPLEKLMWDGTLKKHLVFTATSGSSGKPFYFPRGEELDWQSSIVHEFFLENSSYGKEGPTLVIVTFGMGVWIGGLITYKAFELASARGWDLSILTTGINKIEIFNALRNIAPHYKQVVIAGLAPFVKDIIDEAQGEGVNLKKMNLRFIFAAEAFSESFRDHLAERVGMKNPCLDTMNIYGTADIGTMAYETPTSILMRRLAAKKEKSFQHFFTKINKTPTFAQYNPFFITFEAPRGEILLTGDNSIPLVRYDIGDHGGAMSFDEGVEKLKEEGIDFNREAERAGIQNRITRLPMVYVYERIDQSTTIYGLQIYREMVQEALMDKQLAKIVTSRLTMMTKFNKQHQQYLEIHLELQPHRKPDARFPKRALQKIVETLRLKSSEFRELHDYVKSKALPRLKFWPHAHPEYFPPGVKHKWSK